MFEDINDLPDNFPVRFLPDFQLRRSHAAPGFEGFEDRHGDQQSRLFSQFPVAWFSVRPQLWAFGLWLAADVSAVPLYANPISADPAINFHATFHRAVHDHLLACRTISLDGAAVLRARLKGLDSVLHEAGWRPPRQPRQSAVMAFCNASFRRHLLRGVPHRHGPPNTSHAYKMSRWLFERRAHSSHRDSEEQPAPLRFRRRDERGQLEDEDQQRFADVVEQGRLARWVPAGGHPERYEQYGALAQRGALVPEGAGGPADSESDEEEKDFCPYLGPDMSDNWVGYSDSEDDASFRNAPAEEKNGALALLIAAEVVTQPLQHVSCC